MSTEPAAHVVLISEMYEEMERRRAEASEAKAAGDPDPYAKYAPLIGVLDEFATMRDEWRALFKGNGGDEKIAAMVAAILRVGREPRCHLMISSQDIYVENIPQAWQDTMALFVSLGAPSPRTLAGGAIPEALRPEAQRIGERISRGTPGRAIYIDREAFTVREIQTFYGFSPGTTTVESAPTEEVRAAWAQAEKTAEQVPWLYPRVGIKTDTAEWRKQTAEGLALQETVALNDRNGNPLPNREQYDPMVLTWNGAESVGGRKRRASDDFVDTDGDGIDDRDQASPTPEQVAAMTPEEKEAWMHDHAVRMGWVPADTKTPSSGSTEPEGDTPKAAPKKSTLKPKRGGGDI